MLGALVFAATHAWSNLIEQVFDDFFPSSLFGQTITRLTYAVLLTALIMYLWEQYSDHSDDIISV